MDKTLAGCHRFAAPGVVEIGAVYRGNKAGRFSGLQNSKSVWGSPMAAYPIIRGRTEALKVGMKNHRADNADHSFVFVTLTSPHNRSQKLKDLIKASKTGWKAIRSGGAYTGKNGDAARFGIMGWAMAPETTVGENGWHHHLHAVFFLERDLSETELEAFEARLFERWSNNFYDLGMKRPSLKHGVDVQQVAKGADTDELAGYLTKGMLSGLGAELTGGAFKQARGGNRNMFQVLETMADAEDAGQPYDARDVSLWLEWEKASKGEHFFRSDAYVKEMIGLGDLSDSEVADMVEQADDLEESLTTEGDPSEVEPRLVATVDKCNWKKISSDVDARVRLMKALKAENWRTAQKQFALACDELGVKYRLVTAPIRYESMDIWQQLDSAYGRAEVRAEAAAVNSEMMQDYCTERAAEIAEMYQAYLQ